MQNLEETATLLRNNVSEEHETGFEKDRTIPGLGKTVTGINKIVIGKNKIFTGIIFPTYVTA